ncbi:MAG: NAD(P)H-dependent oxidoreductase [Acidobacteriota bacterium]
MSSQPPSSQPSSSPDDSSHPARRVLVLFAHPALEKSRVNRRLLSAVRDLRGVTVHDLYEAYPFFDIHVEREQELLAAHDVVVLQHPFFWYSTPALVKEWLDLVLEHGWAYGSEGTALRGKLLLSAISTGGREDAYCAEGVNRFTIRQLLAPIEQTARLCGMDYLPPFVVHGALGMISETLERHAHDYRRLLEDLRDGRCHLDAARDWPRLNADLERLRTGARTGGDDAR